MAKEKTKEAEKPKKGPTKFIMHTLSSDTDYKVSTTGHWYKIDAGRPFLVKDEKDQGFFRSMPQRFTEVGMKEPTFMKLGQKAKAVVDKVSGKTDEKFKYKQWLIDNYRDDVAAFVIKKYPTIEALSKASVHDLISIRGVGRFNAEKIFNAVKIMKV